MGGSGLPALKFTDRLAAFPGKCQGGKNLGPPLRALRNPGIWRPEKISLNSGAPIAPQACRDLTPTPGFHPLEACVWSCTTDGTRSCFWPRVPPIKPRLPTPDYPRTKREALRQAVVVTALPLAHILRAEVAMADVSLSP